MNTNQGGRKRPRKKSSDFVCVIHKFQSCMYHKLRKCLNSRRSRQRCYIEKVVLNIHRKTIVLESLFNRLAGFKTCDFLKKRLQHRCFFVKFAKFLRTPFWRTSTNGSFWIYQGLYALPLNDFKETYQMEKPIFKVPKSITEATFWIISKNKWWKTCFCWYFGLFPKEVCTMKFFFQSISWDTNLR